MMKPIEIPHRPKHTETHRNFDDEQKRSNSHHIKSGPRVTGLIVQELLGQGGFGQVWKAKTTNFQYSINNHTCEQEMALKVISKGNNKALKTEFELWRMLSDKVSASAARRNGHDIPIVKMYGVHLTQNGCPAISMQLCKGGSLAQQLVSPSGKQVFLAESDAAMVASRIAEALSFCHQNGVLHLDVKPDNVLIMSDSNSNCGSMQSKLSSCVLADFGLSQMLPHLETSCCQGLYEGPCIVKPDHMSGTVGYMAPEVITNGLYSPAADAWSLGALLLKALTGRLPPHCEENPSVLIWEFEDWKSAEHGDWLDEYMTHLRVEAWSNLSQMARNAIKGLLFPHPGFRITVFELLHHPWVCGNVTASEFNTAQYQQYAAAGCASSIANVPAAEGPLNAAIIPAVY